MDTDKFYVESPDGWHSVPFMCAACISEIGNGEFSLTEMLRLATEHNFVCVPKIWEYQYNLWSLDPDLGELWYYQAYYTDAEKIEFEAAQPNSPDYRFIERKY